MILAHFWSSGMKTTCPMRNFMLNSNIACSICVRRAGHLSRHVQVARADSEPISRSWSPNICFSVWGNQTRLENQCQNVCAFGAPQECSQSRATLVQTQIWYPAGSGPSVILSHGEQWHTTVLLTTPSAWSACVACGVVKWRWPMVSFTEWRGNVFDHCTSLFWKVYAENISTLKPSLWNAVQATAPHKSVSVITNDRGVIRARLGVCRMLRSWRTYPCLTGHHKDTRTN